MKKSSYSAANPQPDLWTPTILAYIAGYVDSGSIHMSRKSSTGECSISMNLRSKDKELMHFFIKHLGGAFSTCVTKAYKIDLHAQNYPDSRSYVFRLTGKKLIFVLNALHPYLRVKRAHANLAMILFEALFKRRVLLFEDHEKRQMIYEEFKELNKKQVIEDIYRKARWSEKIKPLVSLSLFDCIDIDDGWGEQVSMKSAGFFDDFIASLEKSS